MSYTQTTEDTMNRMMEHFVPNDSDYHKQIRQSADAPVNIEDKQFSHQEIRSMQEEMDPKKALGEDGITSAILPRVFNLLLNL